MTTPVTHDEVESVFEILERGFGERIPSAYRQALRKATIPDRLLVSRDGAEIAGTATSEPAQMTLPGEVVAPVAAVVGVAVLPTHRRQGRLRSMMRYQLDDLRARGEDLAVLTSSEARIYQRFGYGPATLASTYRLEKRDLSLLWPERVDLSGVAVRFVERDEAERHFPPLLAAHQPTRAGEVSRLTLGWEDLLGVTTEDEQKGRFFVECVQAGEPVGYAVYRIGRDPGVSGRVLHLVELCALRDSSYLALWSYLLEVDLVDTLVTGHRPTDEPVRWLLSDPRRMVPLRTGEHTYARLVEVAASLAARGYFCDGELTVAVTDPFCEWNTGRYHLSVEGNGTAAVERLPLGGAADLTADVSVLASLYLGGLRPSALAQIGLLEAASPRALATADRLFLGPVPPFSTTSF